MLKPDTTDYLSGLGGSLLVMCNINIPHELYTFLYNAALSAIAAVVSVGVKDAGKWCYSWIKARLQQRKK